MFWKLLVYWVMSLHLSRDIQFENNVEYQDLVWFRPIGTQQKFWRCVHWGLEPTMHKYLEPTQRWVSMSYPEKNGHLPSLWVGGSCGPSWPALRSTEQKSFLKCHWHLGNPPSRPHRSSFTREKWCITPNPNRCDCRLPC